MKRFKAPVDNILFSLKQVAGAQRIPDWDTGLAAEIIGHFADFAENEIAPLDEIGDRQGCRLIDGRVRMPGRQGSDQGSTHREKLGLHASPTFQFIFDGASAERLGGANLSRRTHHRDLRGCERHPRVYPHNLPPSSQNGVAADAFEHWLATEGQTDLLEPWRRRRKEIAAVPGSGEAALSFMQPTIDVCRQAVAARIRAIG